MGCKNSRAEDDNALSEVAIESIMSQPDLAEQNVEATKRMIERVNDLRRENQARKLEVKEEEENVDTIMSDDPQDHAENAAWMCLLRDPDATAEEISNACSGSVGDENIKICEEITKKVMAQRSTTLHLISQLSKSAAEEAVVTNCEMSIEDLYLRCRSVIHAHLVATNMKTFVSCARVISISIASSNAAYQKRNTSSYKEMEENRFVYHNDWEQAWAALLERRMSTCRGCDRGSDGYASDGFARWCYKCYPVKRTVHIILF